MKKFIWLLFFAACSAQADDWGQGDTVRQLALTGTLIADYGQTRSISRIPGLWERNKVLGRNPSDEKIALYFIGAGLVSYKVARALPAGWQRQTFQYGVIALQVAVIAKNRKIGMRFEF